VPKRLAEEIALAKVGTPACKHGHVV